MAQPGASKEGMPMSTRNLKLEYRIQKNQLIASVFSEEEQPDSVRFHELLWNAEPSARERPLTEIFDYHLPDMEWLMAVIIKVQKVRGQ